MKKETVTSQQTRAVFYARCSTEEESQRDALKKQVQEAKEWIEKKQWIPVDSYVESCSGTSRKGREEYNRLYEDLLEDKFDVIVIKSQDRLMRNTKDWYLFVDRLCCTGKQLYLYLEQKFYTTDDALITGIKAILAEEYSRELSKKMNLAHQNRQKNGGTPVLTSNTYGYRKLPDHRVVIDEKEAQIKRRMYELCAEGYGGRTIAKIFAQEGICNCRGGYFSGSDILRMIRNPLNKGTIVMNRSHYEFETGKTIRNPKSEQYIYEGKIPAIVSEELWERANFAIEERKKRSGSAEQFPAGFSRRYPFSQKLFCGQCGCVFCRTTRKKKEKNMSIHEWKCKNCISRGKNPLDGGCQNICLEEEKLYQAIEKSVCALNCIEIEMFDQMIAGTMKFFQKAIPGENEFKRRKPSEKKSEKIRKQQKLLLDKLLEGVVTDDQYKKRYRELEQQMELLKAEEKEETAVSVKCAKEERMEKIEAFLRKNQDRLLTDAILAVIQRIHVYPEYLLIFWKKAPLPGILQNPLRIDWGEFSTSGERKQMQKELEELQVYIGDHPKTTAKELSTVLGISQSAVYYRIRILRKEGRICYEGRGGHGIWRTCEKDQKE